MPKRLPVTHSNFRHSLQHHLRDRNHHPRNHQPHNHLQTSSSESSSNETSLRAPSQPKSALFRHSLDIQSSPGTQNQEQLASRIDYLHSSSQSHSQSQSSQSPRSQHPHQSQQPKHLYRSYSSQIFKHSPRSHHSHRANHSQHASHSPRSHHSNHLKHSHHSNHSHRANHSSHPLQTKYSRSQRHSPRSQHHHSHSSPRSRQHSHSSQHSPRSQNHQQNSLSPSSAQSQSPSSSTSSTSSPVRPFEAETIKLSDLPCLSLQKNKKMTIKDGKTDNPFIIIKKFNDYRPQPGTQYFEKPRDVGPNKNHICICVPCYNEPHHEIQQTLNSVYDAFIYLRKYRKSWRNKHLYIIVIQDGWHRAHKTTQLYINDMYETTIDGKPWTEYYDEFKPTFKDPSSNATFVFERKNYMQTAINTQDDFINNRKSVRMTWLVKINNRRKHNSHEWFLGKSGFAETINAKYLLLTDAFTLFSESCLYYLVRHLEEDPSLVAVTGRQRLMSREQQGSNESLFSFKNWLRKMQLKDFEDSNSVHNGVLSLCGLLSVIPGPCGMFDADALLCPEILDAYFNLVNSEPSEIDIATANLRIAEDRALSTYSVTKNPKEKFMAFNNLAVFYFEAETNLRQFMAQRRRWFNGAFGGYVKLIVIDRKEFFAWKTNKFRIGITFFYFFLQLISYVMVLFAPGISMKIMYYGIVYIMRYRGLEIDKVGEGETKSTAIFMSIIAIYLIHIYYHHKQDSANAYSPWIMGLLVIMSAATTVLSFVSLGLYYFVERGLAFQEIFTENNFFLYIALAAFIGPYIIATLLGGRGHSPMYMFKSTIQYVLLLPLMISWFSSYAISRIWDLSWGNRPSNELVEGSESEKEKKITEFKDINKVILLVLIAGNIGIFWVPLFGQLIIMAIYFSMTILQMSGSFIFCIKMFFYKGKIYKTKKRVEKEYRQLESDESWSLYEDV